MFDSFGSWKSDFAKITLNQRLCAIDWVLVPWTQFATKPINRQYNDNDDDQNAQKNHTDWS